MNTLKAIIVGIITVLLANAHCYGQSPQQNLKKYWYYRYRLMNNFMVKGDCQGCSEIMNERGRKDNQSHNTTPSDIAAWGDQTINLGEYIAVLATEYKLLLMNNQPTDTTLQELYYAIKAFNRLDESAEPFYYYGGCVPTPNPHTDPSFISGSQNGNNLNGYFIRDDVPCDFLTLHPQLQAGKNSTLIVSRVVSDFTSSSRSTAEMSQDQIWHLFMGFALVRKYLHSGISYRGLPLNHKNSNSDIYQEALDITNRIINRIKDDNWTVKNEVTGRNVYRGYQVAELSYGAAEAACYIQNLNTGLNIGYPLHSCNDYHDAISYADANMFNDYGRGIGSAIALHYDDYKVQMLAAIGNSWWLSVNPIVPDPIALMGTLVQPNFMLHPSEAIGALTAMLESLIPIPINLTSPELAIRASFRDNQHLPMLRQLLHGGTNPLLATYDYEGLLNSAPCEGIYNFSGSYGECPLMNGLQEIDYTFRMQEVVTVVVGP
jgi:hypothetical protein